MVCLFFEKMIRTGCYSWLQTLFVRTNFSDLEISIVNHLFEYACLLVPPHRPHLSFYVHFSSYFYCRAALASLLWYFLCSQTYVLVLQQRKKNIDNGPVHLLRTRMTARRKFPILIRITCLKNSSILAIMCK